ncbi:hypothetical protein B0H12DRAFT_1044160, partial [Mycena haematopus]
RATKTSATEKTVAILAFIKDTFPKFSLKNLLTELFTSENSAIKNVTNTYLGTGGHIHILETAFGDKVIYNPTVASWILDKAAEICSREVSQLTDTASKGDYWEEAKSLRLSSHSV